MTALATARAGCRVLAIVAALLATGCSVDQIQRAGYAALAHHACTQERPARGDCIRSYHREYEEFSAQRESLLKSP